jgi:6-phosphogluconolactonase
MMQAFYSLRLFGVVAIVLAAALGSASDAEAARAYIGTFTPNPLDAVSADAGHGEGIYLVDIDDSTGAPSNPRLVAKTVSPTWITLSANGKFLYSVSSVSNYGPGKSGSVSAYAVDMATGALKTLNTVSSEGAGPAYISINSSGKFVQVADYGGGAFAIIRINDDGSLGEATDVVRPGGPLSPATANDTQPGQFLASDHRGSHGHMINNDASGRFVVGDDAGRDQIFVWKLDQNTGKLFEVSVTRSLPGSAPRHFVFSPDGKTLYQLQEQDSRLQIYDFDDGKPTPRGASISTLPDGYQGSNTGSELLIDVVGAHLYSANRTQDTIATFTAGGGSVARVANTHTEADNPRSLSLDPTGTFLYSLNRGGNNVAAFRIGADGVPKFTGKILAIGTPAVMVFLP